MSYNPEIPFEKQGCPRVRQEWFRPVKGFLRRIEQAAQRQVNSYGDNSRFFGRRPPTYVGFVGGGTASSEVVEKAWNDADAAVTKQKARVDEAIEACPGFALCAGRAFDSVCKLMVPEAE